VANSPAHIASLKTGDVIISLNHSPISSVDEIHRHLSKDIIGNRLELVVLRDWTNRLEMSIVPAESPD
jgi:S1-C subfamily serine protease